MSLEGTWNASQSQAHHPLPNIFDQAFAAILHPVRVTHVTAGLKKVGKLDRSTLLFDEEASLANGAHSPSHHHLTRIPHPTHTRPQMTGQTCAGVLTKSHLNPQPHPQTTRPTPTHRPTHPSASATHTPRLAPITNARFTSTTSRAEETVLMNL